MKITAIIVDDEKNSREVLQSLVQKFCPGVALLGEAHSVETAYKLIHEKNPELVFLDVQMPTGNGFSLLRMFPVLPFMVIFVTSFDQYAINAIRFSAVDYLLKPIEVKDLEQAVERAAKQRIHKQVNIVNLLHNLNEKEENKMIPVHVQGSVKFLNSADITHIQADGPYTHLHTKNGEKYTSARTLKDFEGFFGGHQFFVRINKSMMINVKYVKEYTKNDPCIITLTNKLTVEASRRKKQEVMEKLRK